jgi:hypothetical protein
LFKVSLIYVAYLLQNAGVREHNTIDIHGNTLPLNLPEEHGNSIRGPESGLKLF